MSLSPADDPGPGPWRGAVLTLSNRSGRPVRAVSGRMRLGAAEGMAEVGPTFLFPLVVPGEANLVATVAVPLSAPAQEYILHALPEASAAALPLATKTVTVSWPADRAAPVDFLAPDIYGQHEGLAESWPAATRRILFIAAVITCAAMVAALFLRKRSARLVAVGVIAVAGTVAILMWASNLLADRASAPFLLTTGEPTTSPATRQGVAPARMMIVSTPRTRTWFRPETAIVPLYRSAADMAHDDAVIEDGKGITFTVHGGEVRIFLLPGETRD